MSWVKTLFAVTFGVAAVPFTGGASLATVALSTGTTAALGAAAAGTAVVVGKYAKKKIHDEPINKARKEGFSHGVRKGNIATAKKFAKRMAADDNLKIGVFALAVYVANKDKAMSEKERAEIERYLGRPDSRVNKTVRDEFKNIYESTPSFPKIRDKYLNGFSKADLEETNLFIMDVINSDNTVSKEEKTFLSRQWNPYLEQRGII